MKIVQLPQRFQHTIVGVHKERGERWLRNFENLLHYCEERWAFEVQEPYPLSYNFVAPVLFHDGTSGVLKLGVPSGETNSETETLRLLNGNGMVKLLEVDIEKGIMLLEKCLPGNTLKSIQDDEEAVKIAAAVMRQIRIPAPKEGPFDHVSDWARGLKKLRNTFQGGTGPLPEELVTRAEDLYTELLASTSNQFLLHGDLHHENILSAERMPWLAIDPKGLIGEAEYEVIPFLLNNLPQQNLLSVTKRRVELFAEELGVSGKRILQWAFCHSVLSAWWHVEENTDGMESTIKMAECFHSILEQLNG